MPGVGRWFVVVRIWNWWSRLIRPPEAGDVNLRRLFVLLRRTDAVTPLLGQRGNSL